MIRSWDSEKENWYYLTRGMQDEEAVAAMDATGSEAVLRAGLIPGGYNRDLLIREMNFSLSDWLGAWYNLYIKERCL